MGANLARMAVTGWRARPVACVSIVFAVGHHSGCSALRERGVHFIFELEGLTGKTWPQVGWSEGFCRGCQETLAMTPNSSAMRITDFWDEPHISVLPRFAHGPLQGGLGGDTTTLKIGRISIVSR